MLSYLGPKRMPTSEISPTDAPFPPHEYRDPHAHGAVGKGKVTKCDTPGQRYMVTNSYFKKAVRIGQGRGLA